MKLLYAEDILCKVWGYDTEVIRYFVLHNFLCNFDNYTGSMVRNYYLYEEDGVLSMIPWDYNLAFGGFIGAQNAALLANYSIDQPVSGGTIDSRPMLAWIFASEEYTQLYHEYFSEFIASVFESGSFAQEISRVREMITPYVEKDPLSSANMRSSWRVRRRWRNSVSFAPRASAASSMAARLWNRRMAGGRVMAGARKVIWNRAANALLMQATHTIAFG